MILRAIKAKDAGLGACVAAVLFAVTFFAERNEWQHVEAVERVAFERTADSIARGVVAKLDGRLDGLAALHEALRDGTVTEGAGFEVAAALIQGKAAPYLAINLIDRDRRIAQVWPAEPNRAALGRTVGQSPAIVALLDEARMTRRPKATGIVDLFQGGQGLVVYYPIHRDGEFRGYLNAVFRVADLDEDIVALAPASLAVRLFDGAAADAAADPLRHIHVSDIPVLNRHFRLEVSHARGVRGSADYFVALVLPFALSLIAGGTASLLLARSRLGRAEEALLANLTRSLPLALITVDARGRILRFNPAAERIFGVPAHAALSREIHDFVPVDRRDAHRGLTAGFMESDLDNLVMGDWRSVEAQRADGARFPVSVLLTKTLIEGQRVATAIVTDMTEEQRKQIALVRLADDREAQAHRALSASQAKTMFLASMSHELRTPLNAIIGFSEMIDQEILGRMEPKKYAEYIKDILSSARGLLALINDILDYSKIEAGAHRPNMEAIALEAAVEQAVRTARGIAHEKNIQLVFQAGGAPTAVMGDARAIRQVLLNVFSNAIKFSPAGSTVTVAAAAPDAEGRAAIVVEDRGEGIPPTFLANLGQPFHQARGDSAVAGEGTGLGLAISIGLMRSMGGDLKIDSEVGRGTRVILAFDRAGTMIDPA